MYEGPGSDLSRALDLARRQLSLGQTAGAIESLRRVLAEDPDHADAHALLAIALLRQKRLAAADHEAGMALTLEPEGWLPLFASGKILMARRRLDEAVDRFEALRALDPTSSAPLLALAQVRGLQGRRGEVGGLLEKARHLDPESVDVLSDLGDFYLGRGDVEKAEVLAREALSLEPEDADALILMGGILLRRGKVEEARDHAIWALRQDPEDQGALHLLAEVKARTSKLLGLWWRWSSWMGTLEDGRAVVVLLFAYVVYRFAGISAEHLEHRNLATLVDVVWLAIVAYTWIGPGLFYRSLRRELDGVSLRQGF